MSKMIKITFPNGSIKEFELGTTPLDIAKSISEGLARACVCAKLNGVLCDLTKQISEDSKIELIKFDQNEGKEIFWHSSAHILAQAVTRLYPKAKPTIGPAIDNGFYYDFDSEPFKPEDLEKIEKEMKKIVDEKLPIIRKEISRQDAEKLFSDNIYKKEIIKEYSDENLTVYEQGEYIDLCKGPHIINTGVVKAFKLTKVSGAYWRGDSNNKSLSRIYGISFPDNKLLKEHLTLIEEAEKRDHRKIGKELNLFSFHEEAPGMPFFHNKGSFIWNTLHEYVKDLMIKKGYEINKTPFILNKSLWLQSGHWDHYKENMYFTKIDSDEENYAVKPMNCPGNILVYKVTQHSYRELPIRAGEFGLVHRHELSGVLSGLFRVRCFTQDDAHVFCTKEQIKDEVKAIIDFIDEVYSLFGFEYNLELSTKPDKALGNEELWELAENTLKEVLEETKKGYKINPGDGAFYGPKIDFHLKDAIGRTWQCGTVQLDFQMPEKFDLTYEGADGKKHRPVMLHRVILGSVERFIGVLIEHFAGKLPLWISPLQIKILPIADRHFEYSRKLYNNFKQLGLNCEIDERSETVNKKVRDAQLEQANYILVVGDKEIESESVNVRTRDNRVVGAVKFDDFVKKIKEEIEKKSLNSVF
jgi:threonyl-tRNA synthetase